VVLFGLRALLDDGVDQLTHGGLQPNFPALTANQGWHVLKFKEIVTPRLLMANGSVLQRASTPSANGWVRHDHSILLSSPGVLPAAGIITAHSYDVSIVSIECARNVKWLSLHMSHKQGFGVGTVVRILLDDISLGHDVFQVGMGDLA
jgi:hypothetical protein